MQAVNHHTPHSKLKLKLCSVSVSVECGVWSADWLPAHFTLHTQTQTQTVSVSASAECGVRSVECGVCQPAQMKNATVGSCGAELTIHLNNT